jgi:cytochrome c-type biogenesis protein CcmH
MSIAFWCAAALLLGAALLFVLPPLLRPATAVSASTSASPLDVYREQRAQLDAELAQGLLTPEQHTQALTDWERRVLEELGEVEPRTAAPARPRPLASIVAVALLLPAGALALYGTLGQPAALVARAALPSPDKTSGAAPHTMSREQMEALVEQLATRLQSQPNDADGWHMLARSYVAFGRLAEAAQAYDRASALAPNDAQVLADHADALAMLNGRNLEGRPLALVEAALKIAPNHAKALSLAGTAAFNRHDYAGAVQQWRKLQATLPPDSEPARAVATSIAQAQAAAAADTPTTQAGAAGSAAAPGAASGATVEGQVVVAAALAPRIAAGDTLFVFARAVTGPRMPLAILRMPAGSFPQPFKLDDTSAMSPQFKLSGQPQVMLGARISRSGNATPQSGDLMGTLGPVAVGSRELQVLIDGVVP